MSSAQRWASCATTRPNPHGRSFHRTRTPTGNQCGRGGSDGRHGRTWFWPSWCSRWVWRMPSSTGPWRACGYRSRWSQVPAAAAIALRSLHPFPALLLALSAMAGESILIGADPESPAAPIAVLLVLYSVAAHADLGRAAFGLALGIAVPLVIEVTADNGDIVDLWVIAPVFAVPWLAGRAARASRRQADRLRLLTARLERERDARVRLALIEEHTRIARELHDSIAHAVSVMVLQAGAAEQVLDSAPERRARPSKRCKRPAARRSPSWVARSACSPRTRPPQG